MGNIHKPQNQNLLKRLFSKSNELDQAHDERQFINGEHHLLNYYSSLAMYHPDLIIVLSRDGDIYSQNKRSIFNFFGYRPEKIEDFKTFLSKESYQTLHYAFHRTLKGQSEKRELTLMNTDNEMIHIVVTFIPIKVSVNDIEGVYVVVEDITDYVHMYETIERNEKHCIWPMRNILRIWVAGNIS